MSKKTNIICILLTVVMVVLIIGVAIFAVVRNKNNTPVDETLLSVMDTTEFVDSSTDPDIPMIPGIVSTETKEENHEPSNPGDVSIDIFEGNETTGRSNEPLLEGEVIIIPGVKGDDE